MATRLHCRITPELLLERTWCLDRVSKDVRGELLLLDADRERCEPLDCTTLKTLHALRLEVERHDCDDERSALLDGALVMRELVTVYQDGDGNGRGLHAGTFRWRGRGLLVEGSMEGVTNAGTHRAPHHQECQKCEAPGFMDGRLCGRVVRAEDRSLVGADLLAAYLLRFDPSSEGGSGGIAGSIEGGLLRDCRRSRPQCVDLTTLQPPSAPNPRAVQGVSFETRDPAGNPTPASEIRPMGAFHGLDVGFSTEVRLPPASAVEATLVHFSRAPTLEAFNRDGTSAGTATMSGPQAVPETLRVTGTDIDRAVITAPADETLLLSFCHQPTA